MNLAPLFEVRGTLISLHLLEKQSHIKSKEAAVSQHLKVLRDTGFARAHVAGAKRIYELQAEPRCEVNDWLARFSRFWEPKLDALETEIVRGKLQRSKK